MVDQMLEIQLISSILNKHDVIFAEVVFVNFLNRIESKFND